MTKASQRFRQTESGPVECSVKDGDIMTLRERQNYVGFHQSVPLDDGRAAAKRRDLLEDRLQQLVRDHRSNRNAPSSNLLSEPLRMMTIKGTQRRPRAQTPRW